MWECGHASVGPEHGSVWAAVKSVTQFCVFVVFFSLHRLFLALGCFVSISVRWVETRTEEQTKNYREYDDYVCWCINFNEVPLDWHSMTPHDNKVPVYPVCVYSLLYSFELLRMWQELLLWQPMVVSNIISVYVVRSRNTKGSLMGSLGLDLHEACSAVHGIREDKATCK
jgi:hypothetical protein